MAGCAQKQLVRTAVKIRSIDFLGIYVLRLLRRISASTGLVELVGTTELKRAVEYESKGWVVVYRTHMPATKDADAYQTAYARITDSGRQILKG